MQVPDPGFLAVVVALLKYVGAPAATALGFIVLMRKAILPKANGKDRQDTAQRLDLALTTHFDQLRRDLTTTIERQHALSRDDARNALTTHLLELELGRLRAGDKA